MATVVRRKARGKGILTKQVMQGSDDWGYRGNSIVLVRVSTAKDGSMTQTETSYPKTAQNIRTATRFYGRIRNLGY